MHDIFLVLALVFVLVAGLLFFAPHRKLLNFVDYGPGGAVRRLNRYAAVRLLIPLLVNLGCHFMAARRPELTVPLVFLTPLSVLCVVVWVGIGSRRFATARVSSGGAPPTRT